MEAEDVVQDVFVKMLETEVIIPAEKMRAWMYRVSIRRYIDRYRRDKHYLEILRKEFFGKDLVNPFENEDYELLRSMIEDLPLKEATLLELYYFQDFTVKEIAQIMSSRFFFFCFSLQHFQMFPFRYPFFSSSFRSLARLRIS